jgi:hypothetical protein
MCWRRWHALTVGARPSIRASLSGALRGPWAGKRVPSPVPAPLRASRSEHLDSLNP